MIQEGVIPIDFGGGTDTKTDPKAVVPGKFLRLENGIFTNPKRIAKRNGYTALGTNIANFGTLTSPQMVNGYNNELIAVDQNQLISYSSNQNAWVTKGSYTSVDLGRTLFSEDVSSTGIADSAILGNYAVYGWLDLDGTIYGSFTDLSTGTVLVKSVLASGSALSPPTQLVKCVLLGGTTLAVIYQKNTSIYYARTVVFSGSGVVSFSAETAITTSSNGALDIVPTATGAAFVYLQSATPGITVATLSTALALSSVNISVTVGMDPVIAISTTSNGNIWIYWTESTDDGSGNLTTLKIYYAVYSSSLVLVLGRTLAVTTATPYYVSAMVATGNSATQQTLYYGLLNTSQTTNSHAVEVSKYVTVTSAGVIGTPTLFANGVIPFSHTFTTGSRVFMVMLYRTPDIGLNTTAHLNMAAQATLFVVELTNLQSPPYVVARFGSGVSGSWNGYQVSGNIFPQNVASFSSTKFYFTCGIVVQAGSPTANVYVEGSIGVFSYSFDFNSVNANIAKNTSNVTVLNGAVLQLYDGGITTELGFHLFPEIVNPVATSTANALDVGVYSYLAIYQWIDSQGNLHQSAPSVPVTVNVTGGTESVTFAITTAYLTRKPNVSVYIYRTIGAGGLTGSIYYLVGIVSGDSTVNPFVLFTDLQKDAAIIGNLQAYTYPASAVLENTTPPPSMIGVTHNNRFWFVDSENPNTIWYTKSSQDLVGLSPSGFLIEQIDDKYGNISGLAEMDDKLIIGKTNGIFIQSGDGANDTGSGITLSFPQSVPSDVGITVLKSIILMPRGVMFKSANGIYMIDRALNISYIGAEVEGYNSQVITSASLVPGKSQIRFLCSTGLALVYDYIFNQWSTFTNHTGPSSSTWNNLYIYATTGGSVFKEAAGTYLDNATPFSLLLQSSWLALAGIQGFQRVRRLIMLGDYVNGSSASHNMTVAAAYDFSPTFQPLVASPPFGSASTSGVFQYRERLPIQKCDSLSVLIQEATTGDSAEYLDLTNISFEAGMKKGVNKLRGEQSVG